MSQIKSNNVKVNFNYESSESFELKCNLNDKIEKILHEFSSKYNKDFDSHLFIFNGGELRGDLDKTLNQVMNFVQKEDKSMVILVCKKELESRDDINEKDNIKIIIFLDAQKYLQLKGKKERN